MRQLLVILLTINVIPMGKHLHYLNTSSFVMLSGPNSLQQQTGNLTFADPIITSVHPLSPSDREKSWHVERLSVWISSTIPFSLSMYSLLVSIKNGMYYILYDRSVTIHLVLRGGTAGLIHTDGSMNLFCPSANTHEGMLSIKSPRSLLIQLKGKESILAPLGSLSLSLSLYTASISFFFCSSLSFAHAQPSAYRILGPLLANLLFTSFSFFFLFQFLEGLVIELSVHKCHWSEPPLRSIPKSFNTLSACK